MIGRGIGRGIGWGDCVKFGDVATLDCITSVFENVIFYLMAFVGIVAVFLIIFSGIKFITSGGDPKQVEGARNTMTYAIIGLLVVVLSFLIIRLIANITGVNCITFFGFGSCQ